VRVADFRNVPKCDDFGTTNAPVTTQLQAGVCVIHKVKRYKKVAWPDGVVPMCDLEKSNRESANNKNIEDGQTNWRQQGILR